MPSHARVFQVLLTFHVDEQTAIQIPIEVNIEEAADGWWLDDWRLGDMNKATTKALTEIVAARLREEETTTH